MKNIILMTIALLLAISAVQARQPLPSLGSTTVISTPVLRAGPNRLDSPQQDSDRRAKALSKFLEAQKLEQAGNYSGAVAAYKEAISLDPASPDLKIALGSLYLKGRNIIDAETQAREAMQLAPASPQAHKLMARVYFYQTFVGAATDKEKARLAVKELEEVAKLGPDQKVELGNDEIPVLAAIGEIYLRLDDTDKALEAFKRLSAADASSDKALVLLAQLYFNKNKYREAADAVQKAYQINQDPSYLPLLARSLLRVGRTQEALDYYKKALGIKDPKDKTGNPEQMAPSQITLEYAEALVYAGKFDEAKSFLDPIIKNASKDSSGYLKAVEIQVNGLRRSGKREEAVQTLEAALKGQDVSESLSLLFELAETYEEMQQFDKAVDTYEEALKSILNPDGSVADHAAEKQNAAAILSRIGLSYRLGGKRDKAIETFGRMKKVLGPDNPQPDELITDTLMDEGKYQEALASATEASKRFADERRFKLYMAQASGKLNDLPAAEATLKGLLNNTAEDASVYSFMASIQLEANQLKAAEESTRKAIAIDARDIEPLVTLSIIQERQKKFKDSEATLRKAIEIDPDNSTLLNNLGYYLTERGEHLQEAEALIQRAVNIAPTNGSFLDSLGWLQFKQGRSQEAQKNLERAIVYSPRSSAIHDHLGDLYKKLGQTQKAKENWEAALKFSTEPDESNKIKDKLAKLK